MDEKLHYDTARSAAGVKYPFVSLQPTCLRWQDDFMDEERFLLGPAWRDYNPETLPSWMINSFLFIGGNSLRKCTSVALKSTL
jgi:hypothetical protein